MENQVEYETLLLLHGVKSTFVSARLEKSTIATECGHLGLVKAADRTHIPPSLFPPPSSQLSDSSWPRILKLHRYLGTSAQPKGLDACASFCSRQVVHVPAETQRRVFLSCASLWPGSHYSLRLLLKEMRNMHFRVLVFLTERAGTLKAEGIAQVCSEGGGP